MTVPIDTGTRLGPYQIVSRIGAGGMGEVFRAKDMRLDRDVAIKVLPASFATNEQFRVRFEREARTISSLNHPHICTIYDIGHQNGTDYIVMEMIEGESLADRLTKGALPLDQVLRYGAEIASALDAAHRKGIIHRDLKPGNVMLTRSGAKLLDFGLARFSASPVAVSNDGATERKPLTEEGTIVGTLQYMAPEQLESQQADARTDIFALGAVLYEMATGQRAFRGQTRTSVIAAIVSGISTPVPELQPLAPPALVHVITRSLAKEPDGRWQSASDLSSQLRWISENQGAAQSSSFSPAAKGRRRRELVPWMIALLMTVAALAAVMMLRLRKPSPLPAIHLTALPPADVLFDPAVEAHNVSLSPDGANLVFVAKASGSRRMLWIRPLGGDIAKPLAGTEGAGSPFWSPDSRFIAFFADGQLKRIAHTGGPTQTICSAVVGSGTWGSGDIILFAESEGREGIQRVPVSGGDVTPAMTPVPRRPAWHYWPSFLPDGRRFLYLATDIKGKRSLFVGALDSNQPVPVAQVTSRAVYAPPGYLIHVREAALLTQEFDLDSFRVRGEPRILAARVPYFETIGWADFSVSQNGVLAYQGGAILSRLVWFDRSGREIGSIGEPAGYGSIRLSPDQRKLAFSRSDPSSLNDDLWVYDLSREVATRFTSEPGNEFNPIWHPDADRIVYAFDIKGSATLYQKRLDGAGIGEQLLPMERFKLPLDFSSDRRLILYSDTGSKTGFDLWLLPLDGDGKPRPFQQTQFEETAGAFSPDSRWIAFVSSESGLPEVYVQRTDGSGEKHRISVAGGVAPRWRGDGREIYYLASDDRIMAVPVSPGQTFEAGKAVPLFRTDSVHFKGIMGSFDVSLDGQRFLVNTNLPSRFSPIDIVMNWQ